MRNFKIFLTIQELGLQPGSEFCAVIVKYKRYESETKKSPSSIWISEEEAAAAAAGPSSPSIPPLLPTASTFSNALTLLVFLRNYQIVLLPEVETFSVLMFSSLKTRVSFYSRSEFIFDPVKWPRLQMDEDFLRISRMFDATRSVVRVPKLDPKFKIAVLASKQEHCLIDLLHSWQDGRLPVDITRVISNHDRFPNTHVIRFLERNGIPYHYLHTTNENKREDEILDLVQNTDFLVLARYMQLISSKFLLRYRKDIINIHHGLLPSFKGGHPSKAGPIIEQMVERVSHRDNIRSFVQKSESLEKQCLAKAIKSYCEIACFAL
ncbi:hypothetical protein OIU78_010385 [Salix suchowensis]|nr:hypothetical protein OIU78_010385 [Salix suchowensis]